MLNTVRSPERTIFKFAKAIIPNSVAAQSVTGAFKPASFFLGP
jgi:hypothetical protein